MRCMHLIVVSLFLLLVAGCGNLTKPMDFYFTTQTNVAQSATITSNTITILGNQFEADISIVNGQYSIDGGAYTSVPGKIKLNQTLTIQQTSASDISTATITTVTVGGYTTTFTSITSSALMFATQSSVFLKTLIESNSLKLPASLSASSAISISNGEYAISTDGGTTWSSYTSAAGTVEPGQRLKVRQTSSAATNTDVVTTVTVSGLSPITFTTHTGTTFSFTTQNDVDLGTQLVSDNFTLPSYLAASTAISIVNGEYSTSPNGGTTWTEYTSTAGTVDPGQLLRVRQTSSAAEATSTLTTVTVGSTPITFTTVTKSIPKDASGKILVLTFQPSPSLNPPNTYFGISATIKNTDTVSAAVTVNWKATTSTGAVVASDSFTTGVILAGQTVTNTYVTSQSPLLTTTYDSIATWSVVSVVRN
ncbi:hypothetical protein F6V25_13210 [Oryzomonas japonica]|uniref:Uncharacterized protein n=1 Tax=Oryzomonas japonica TaxID=2603858 RepID=A0A7J4ZNZ5_9BACT|nr:hypothetical protein [Oryzomonas japonica]KAB0664491.1 hypothetical protein F6V25_13210 [Oryzomonas japonica]